MTWAGWNSGSTDGQDTYGTGAVLGLSSHGHDAAFTCFLASGPSPFVKRGDRETAFPGFQQEIKAFLKMQKRRAKVHSAGSSF